jgi:hypothetical protein
VWWIVVVGSSPLPGKMTAFGMRWGYKSQLDALEQRLVH